VLSLTTFGGAISLRLLFRTLRFLTFRLLLAFAFLSHSLGDTTLDIVVISVEVEGSMIMPCIQQFTIALFRSRLHSGYVSSQPSLIPRSAECILRYELVQRNGLLAHDREEQRERDTLSFETLTTGSEKGVTCQSRRLAALPRQNSIGMPHINRSQ